MISKKTPFLAAFAATLLMQTGNAFADRCFNRNDSGFRDAIGDRTSWGIPRRQAGNTWDDWVWRGPEFFRCPKRGVNHFQAARCARRRGSGARQAPA